jgi:hypothetical protein
LPEAKKGFVLLPRRWVVERTFAWAVRFRRLVRDYERYASTLEGFHLVAFVCLMLKKATLLAAGSQQPLVLLCQKLQESQYYQWFIASHNAQENLVISIH